MVVRPFNLSLRSTALGVFSFLSLRHPAAREICSPRLARLLDVFLEVSPPARLYLVVVQFTCPQNGHYVPCLVGNNPHVCLDWTTSKLSIQYWASSLPGKYMAGCQNYGLFLGTLNIRGRIIIEIQKGTIILTTTHILSETRRHFALQFWRQTP